MSTIIKVTRKIIKESWPLTWLDRGIHNMNIGSDRVHKFLYQQLPRENIWIACVGKSDVP